MTTVIWIPAFGLDGRYEVSSDGRIRSISSDSEWSRWRGYAGAELRPVKKPSGYFQVSIRIGDKEKSLLLHRLILSSFTGKIPDGMQCCHNNGDKSDNRIDNLRWGTSKENHADKYKHGTIAMGHKHPMAKFSRDTELLIANADGTISSISRRYGVGRHTVRSIKSNYGTYKRPEGYRVRVEDVS